MYYVVSCGIVIKYIKKYVYLKKCAVHGIDSSVRDEDVDTAILLHCLTTP